jgi:hypothetical protein
MKTYRRSVCLAVAALLAFSCSVAGSEEVVRFQDGRYMKVEGHELLGKAVKLNLDNDSLVVLPLDRIDTIRSAGQLIYSADSVEPQGKIGEQQPERPEPVDEKRG